MNAVTPLYSQLALRFTELYFLFFIVLWAYSKSHGTWFWVSSFVVLLGAITLYDLFMNTSEMPELIWQTWSIPAVYLVITLLLPFLTGLGREKEVPKRVRS